MSRETYPYNATNYKIWFSLYFLLLFWSYEHFLPKDILHPVSFTGVPLRRSLRPHFISQHAQDNKQKLTREGMGNLYQTPKAIQLKLETSRITFKNAWLPHLSLEYCLISTIFQYWAPLSRKKAWLSPIIFLDFNTPHYNLLIPHSHYLGKNTSH